MSEWISVKDRLPEFEQEVLLYWKWTTNDKEKKEYESYETGYLVEVRSRKSKDGVVNYPEFRIGEDYDNSNPTHWMALYPPKDLTKKE